MTALFWVASAAGALLFVAVGFIVARLVREEPPAPLPLPAEGPSPAELAKLRLELEAARRDRTAAHEALQASERARHEAVAAAELAAAQAPAGATAAEEALEAKLAAVKRHLAEARAELEVTQGEVDRQQLDWRRRSGELEATLESLSKERDSAFQQVAELERLIPVIDDDEPTNLELSPAQFELLKDQLSKAEARERALATELAEYKSLFADGDFAEPGEGGERKPSTLLGMKAPRDDGDDGDGADLNRDFDHDSRTREYGRPKTLLGVKDPLALYREAQVELDRTRAELEKARTEASFWKKHAEKLTAEGAGSRSSSGRGRARASVGLKPTATTGRGAGKGRSR
jgi:hypothetical protein